MVQLENPFPGMNPFLESRWSDAHTRLIAYIGDALSEELPSELSVRAEERVTVTGSDEKDQNYRADITIRETPGSEFPPLWRPGGAGENAVAIAEPEIYLSEPITERWLEIKDREGRLITALELLSPRNKENPGRAEYMKKQEHFIAAGVHLVEIDLVREGCHTVAVHPGHLKGGEGTHSVICVSRAREKDARHEVYRIPLRERLPAFRIPLRKSDPDVPLDLQPLINRCYRTGRYWQLSHPGHLSRLFPKDEMNWILERLAAGESTKS